MNYAVILAGGVGSRFWPFSRELEPKQFMRLLGEESLLQSTIKRVQGIISPQNTYIITNSIYFYELLNQIRIFGIPEKNIILEPEGKNTAPAIGLCAKLIKQEDKDAVLVVLPADHYIKNLADFRKAIQAGVASAKKNFLVTIGIKPDKPSTAYGYIKVGKPLQTLSSKPQALAVERFLEKPNLDKAKKYIQNKNYYWNSGMFIFKTGVFLEEVKRYLPALSRQLDLIKTTGDIKKAWPRIKPISVDYGIMERSRKIALIPASFYWTDLGSWEALGEVFSKDASGNVLQADAYSLDSSGICVFSKGGRLISTIGIKDLVIADTPDALLVCHRDKTQDVKKVVEMLRSSNRREHRVHFTEKRPWGSFTVLQEDFGFKIKLIEITPRKRLSLQRHQKRAEHWVVVSGQAKVISGKDIRLVNSNESIYIPRGVKHRLQNPLSVPLKIVEVQTGNYLSEEDIERFEDDFIEECRPRP